MDDRDECAGVGSEGLLEDTSLWREGEGKERLYTVVGDLSSTDDVCDSSAGWVWSGGVCEEGREVVEVCSSLSSLSFCVFS